MRDWKVRRLLKRLVQVLLMRIIDNPTTNGH